MTGFFRFPQTAHVAWLGAGAPRDDKLLSPDEIDHLLDGPVVIEEKVDGANLGLSVDPDTGLVRAQNRGQYLHAPFTGQFERLGDWLALHEDRLFDALAIDRLILFGEWLAARHSLGYDALPDLFLAFDVYERETGRFRSTRARNGLAQQIGIETVPALFTGRVTDGVDGLLRILTGARSRYRDGPPEGIVIRREDDTHLIARAKLVRADFTQAIGEHWRRRAIEWNRVQH
ncbi:RNA ligase family protein [Tistrella mobilis]|uniref:DNA ligase III-like protein n=1 Tax=Tistrella mobilis (strain KA081020-065) TaxID=1110502 RepID=I3TU46_TISMK|nr:RNA ligase family protein [Tistrella mobilis]AFK56284.1 DNA ligase III-like protein [Tistrella mobilis KA081020-065]